MKKIEDGTYEPPVLKPAKKKYFPEKNQKRVTAGKKAAETRRRTKSESAKQTGLIRGYLESVYFVYDIVWSK